jgi:hypothetical protein
MPIYKTFGKTNGKTILIRMIRRRTFICIGEENDWNIREERKEYDYENEIYEK